MTKSKNGCLKILCGGAGSDATAGSDPETDAHADEVGAPLPVARRMRRLRVLPVAVYLCCSCSSKLLAFFSFLLGGFELVVRLFSADLRPARVAEAGVGRSSAGPRRGAETAANLGDSPSAPVPRTTSSARGRGISISKLGGGAAPSPLSMTAWLNCCTHMNLQISSF